MRNIENCVDLPEIKAQLVGCARGNYETSELPVIKAELVKPKRKKRVIEGYDPRILVDHSGVCYIFYPNQEIRNLVLRSRKIGKNTLYDLASKEGRPFLKGKDVRMITAISPEKVQKAVELVNAPLTPDNKRELTNFAMNIENRNKPECGLHLLYNFTLNTQTEGSLGYVSPAIQDINYRRGQNGI
jgi:hypothetical protein